MADRSGSPAKKNPLFGAAVVKAVLRKRDGVTANWHLVLSAASKRAELLLVLLQLTRSWGWEEFPSDDGSRRRIA